MSWADEAARIVTQVGFPVAAAGVLLWFVLFRFGEQMTAITTRMEANATAVGALIAQNERQLNEMERQTAALEEIVRYARSREQEPKRP